MKGDAYNMVVMFPAVMYVLETVERTKQKTGAGGGGAEDAKIFTGHDRDGQG